MADCGCELDYTKTPIQIVYCSLHANAEKLRGALSDVALTFHAAAYHVNAFEKCNKPLCKRIRAVLAETEVK